MENSGIEITSIKPTTVSSDGSSVSITVKSKGDDINLKLPLEHLESLIDALIHLSESATVNSALHSQGKQRTPPEIPVPACLDIHEASVVIRPNSALIRWGPYEQSGQVNIYGNAFEALKFAFSGADINRH